MALNFWHHFFTAQFLAKEQRHISRAAKVIKTTTIIISPATVLYITSELTSYSKFLAKREVLLIMLCCTNHHVGTQDGKKDWTPDQTNNSLCLTFANTVVTPLHLFYLICHWWHAKIKANLLLTSFEHLWQIKWQTVCFCYIGPVHL